MASVTLFDSQRTLGSRRGTKRRGTGIVVAVVVVVESDARCQWKIIAASIVDGPRSSSVRF
jgi:hypothetical protein